MISVPMATLDQDALALAAIEGSRSESNYYIVNESLFLCKQIPGRLIR